ncbi:MAG TPA: hypothetical protein VGO52_03530 [Hyphomonadaceae bacterium]|jgi:hypothetical protein|nr:hypothetical protein [Hyphomonadaceae bacterium]
MSDQPSEAPRPILIFVGVVALVALAASMFVGLTTNLAGAGPPQHATAPAPATPHG